ncbi:MAG: hypothetical protein FWC92_08745 [Defluviitaleaceae bacterium]|nr:hypothetical protein [Defluviitaleaceae bacterium]
MRCKKFRPSQSAYVAHSLNPASDCRNCVYFTRFNCGTHPESNPASWQMSQNMFYTV